MKISNYYNIILVFLIVLENLFMFFFRINGFTSQGFNSLGFFITSLSIGILVIRKYYNVGEIKITSKIRSVKLLYTYILYVCVLLVLFKYSRSTINSINYDGWSNIIPSVIILAQRLLAGKSVYSYDAWLSLGSSHSIPWYLPMHWLPVTISEYFHFDARYIAFFVWAIGAIFIMMRSSKIISPILRISIPLLLLFSYFLMCREIPSILGVTVELIIAGYYMLFVCSLNQKNFILSSLFISWCMLSRYYIIGWIPLWLLVLYFSGTKTNFLKIIAALLGWILIIYVIPFVNKDWSISNIFPKGYESASIYEWTRYGDDGLPTHLYSGNGFAYLFYEKYVHRDYTKGFYLLKKVLFIVSLLNIIIMGIWYWFNKTKINSRIFLMASFKIYLTFLLSFYIIPYSYLMITGIFVSIALFAEQAKYNIIDPKYSDNIYSK